MATQTTIYDVIMAYDLSTGRRGGKNSVVKNYLMDELGYFDRWTNPNANSQPIIGKARFLPNTMLWKKNTTRKQSLADLKKAVKHANDMDSDNVTIERFISLKWDDGNYYSIAYSKPYSKNRKAPIKR